MTTKKIRIATRKSPLALWQAEFVRQQLVLAHPDLDVEIITMVTKGDIILDVPLAKVGGKGLFVKELERALLDNRADIAVHSMKDVPITFPEGLGLTTICQRGNPHDAFVSNHYVSIDELPQNAIVGTSSYRRQSQLKAYRPDLDIKNLRGNVGSRLSKLDSGEYDAIILACAGLERLQLASRIRCEIPTELSLPAVGQGAVGIECRLDDSETQELLKAIEHSETHIRVSAERAMNRYLNGSCQVPIGSYATLQGDTLRLRGLVAEPDGSNIICDEITGSAQDAEQLGATLGQRLLDSGAREILDRLYIEE